MLVFKHIYSLVNLLISQLFAWSRELTGPGVFFTIKYSRGLRNNYKINIFIIGVVPKVTVTHSLLLYYCVL